MKLSNIMNHPSGKLLCYLFALVFFEFLTTSSKLGYDDIAKFTWWEWLKFCAGLLAPAMIVVRAYTDGSLNRYVEEHKPTP